MGFEAGFPEATLNFILFISQSGDEDVELAHKPAQVGQAQPEQRDTMRLGRKGGDIFFGRGERGLIKNAFTREESEPAQSDVAIWQRGEEVWSSTEDGVIVIIHDRIGADVDGEDRGEEFQSIDEPLLAVGEVAVGRGVEAAEEGTADTSVEAVIDTFLAIVDVFAARQSHGSPLSILLTVEW